MCPLHGVLIPMAFDVTYLTFLGEFRWMESIESMESDSGNAKFLWCLEFKRKHPYKILLYKSGKRDSICSGCSGFLVPQILRHWNAVFQLLPYKCQSPRLWDTLLLNPAHTPPTIWSLFVMYAKI